MNDDWLARGYVKLREEGSKIMQVPSTDFDSVYSFLLSVGLIDYDVEKEVIWERYYAESDE